MIYDILEHRAVFPSLSVLPDPENMDIAVGISLQSCLEAEIKVISNRLEAEIKVISNLLPVNGRHL